MKDSYVQKKVNKYSNLKISLGSRISYKIVLGFECTLLFSN